MEITFRNYPPFTLTNGLLDFIKRGAPSRDFLEISKSIGKIALAILSLIPVFVADSVLTSASLTFRACSGGAPDRKIPKPCIHPAPNIPRAALPLTNSKQFMKTALREAFATLSPGKTKLYKELIADEGLPPEGCKEYVDIFQWSAGVYLVYFLRNSDNDLSKLYPCTHPEFDHRKSQVHIQELQKKVRKLLVAYSLRNAEEKNSALRKIITSEAAPNLDEDVKNLVNSINEIAILMTQDPYFMKNIYTETATL